MVQESTRAPIHEFRQRLERDIPIARLLLFGSRARGSAHQDSDWDVIIVSPSFRGVRFHDRIRHMTKYWEYGRGNAFDPLPYTPEEFEQMAQEPTIVREAVREGREIE